MNKKITIILALLILAVVSVSIVTAVNDTSDSVAVNDDDSQDTLSEDVDVDKVAADNKDDNDNNDDKIAAEDNDDDKRSENPGLLTIKKVWDDKDNADGKRPTSIKVSVSINGDTQDIELSKAEGWAMSVEIDESVEDSDVQITEEAVDGYTTQVSGSIKEGYTITNTLEDQGGNGTGSEEQENSTDVQPNVEKKVVKKTTTTTTESVKTPVKNEPVKKQAKNEEHKKPKDKHDTGNPVLLGVLAISIAGLAYSLRRKE